LAQALSVLLLWISLCVGVKLEAAEDQWRVWMEARFMKPAANAPVAGAERTLLCGGLWGGGELRAFSKKEWLALGLDWAEFEKKARLLSDVDLEKVEIRYDRDARQVIRFAEVRCRAPLVASAVLSAKFGDRFLDTLGEGLFVAVPNRYQAFVFPKVMGFPVQYTGMILGGYDATAFPVSVELFEYSKGILKAVGMFQQP